MLRSKIKFRNNLYSHQKSFQNLFSISSLHSKKGARNRASSARCEWPSKDIFVFFWFFIYM